MKIIIVQPKDWKTLLEKSFSDLMAGDDGIPSHFQGMKGEFWGCKLMMHVPVINKEHNKVFMTTDPVNFHF